MALKCLSLFHSPGTRPFGLHLPGAGRHMWQGCRPEPGAQDGFSDSWSPSVPLAGLYCLQNEQTPFAWPVASHLKLSNKHKIYQEKPVGTSSCVYFKTSAASHFLKHFEK